MEIYLKLIILISFSVTFVTMERLECQANRELDAQCGKYCYQIVKPLLAHASSVFSKEKSLSELQSKMDRDTQSIIDLQKTIELKDKELAAKVELIESKDKQFASQIESKDKQLASQLELIESKDKQLASQLELIESKDKQLALQTELIDTYRRTRDTTIIERDDEILKLKSLIEEKNHKLSDLGNESAANAAKIKDLQSKQTEYMEYMKKLEEPNCQGKSNTSAMILPNIGPFLVPCDSKLVGSGWIVIQRTIDGTEDFDRNWEEYKRGFGNMEHEYFMGLEKIHLITQSQPHELYIHLEDFNNETLYARYSHFLIGSEEESYELKKLGDYSGNADNVLEYHKNMKFSTKDRDNDLSDRSCAARFKSGWWFRSCYTCNLNGRQTSKAVGRHKLPRLWPGWPLKSTQMMIRRMCA